MFQIIGKIIFNKYIWLVFFPLLIGWGLLTMRVQTRTNFALERQFSSVKQIWGGNLEQPMPSIRYKGFGSDVSTLNRGDIHASEISIKLEMDYRKKGLVYYTGYNAYFQGEYTIHNPEAEKIYLSFIFPYPMQQGEGMLQNVKLLVNGEEDLENTEYQQNLALWTGMLEAEEPLTVTVRYNGRGLNHFIYGFEPGRQINRFRMGLEVIGSEKVDYPVSTMTPTKTDKTPEGIRLIWELDRSLTEFNIGVILPDKLNIARQIGVMSARAPVFFLLFLVSLCVILRISGYPLNFVRIAILCVAYFFFYPLFAYLSVYMHPWASFILSFGILGSLIFNYSRIVYALPVAGAISVAYVFYLGITSIAALFPTHTGLILVIEAVVLLAIVMQVLPRCQDIKILELFDLANIKKTATSKKTQPPNAEQDELLDLQLPEEELLEASEKTDIEGAQK